tara:strand:- start:427 stop:1482 length:1056 start_codon:yes stop_codon:yes gene_type:complete
MSENIKDFMRKFIMNDLIKLLTTLLSEKSYHEISDILNVSQGTVKRWVQNNSVPPLYCFELMKMSGIPIDYSKFSCKEKDQFFTPTATAQRCYSKFLELIGNDGGSYTYIEPSAGSGRFMNVLPPMRRICMDIEPKDIEIFKHDFLEWVPPPGKYVVMGNPPFGLRGQLALKFINHSSKFADYVCFILPQLFESDGKGVPRKRVKGLNLIHSEKLDTNFEDPGGSSIKVECIFQVWSKYHHNPSYDIKIVDKSVMNIYSISDGGTPSTTRNKKMFNACDIYIPSTCFGKNTMTSYNTFDELPGRKGYGIVFNIDRDVNIKKFRELDWSTIAFLSTNSAYNLRTSQIAAVFN